jgi:phosphoglycolate phosphatase
VFDKDGTLIDFHAMWSGWAEALVERLVQATRADVREPLFAMLGYDPVAHIALTGGGLISTPMARLRDMAVSVLVDTGVAPAHAEAAVDGAWYAPDPTTLAHPLGDLGVLFESLRTSGRRIAIATSDDRGPTLRTLEALGLDGWIDAVVCADDGLPSKPAADAVLHLCRLLSTEPARTAVVGDSPADVAMGRAAGAGLVVGVRTGIGSDADLAEADHILDSVTELAAHLA